MLPRFLVPDLDPDRPDARLPPEEAHHLTRVLRLGAGDEIAVFDGRGIEFRGRVASAVRGAVTVSLLERIPAVSPAVHLTLVQAVLKPDAMDHVVRDCTMVGVEVIQPVISARTTVKSSTLDKAGERWRRVALASAKQCGRATLPGIPALCSFGEWLQQAAAGERFILLEPDAAPPGVLTIRDLAPRPVPQTIALIVGPEGGWTTEERLAAIGAGCTPLSLGRLTLRADAVPLVACGAILALWGATPNS
jgi:16S rRNA (uracil1498-N3)-methyltransferase